MAKMKRKYCICLAAITSHCQSNPSLSSYSIWFGSTITHCRTAQYIYVSIFKWLQSLWFGYFGFLKFGDRILLFLFVLVAFGRFRGIFIVTETKTKIFLSGWLDRFSSIRKKRYKNLEIRLSTKPFRISLRDFENGLKIDCCWSPPNTTFKSSLREFLCHPLDVLAILCFVRIEYKWVHGVIHHKRWTSSNNNNKKCFPANSVSDWFGSIKMILF